MKKKYWYIVLVVIIILLFIALFYGKIIRVGSWGYNRTIQWN
ncbi:hypothetical protein [Kaistella flava (ex Peng et al. 2021)]|nr:hypothetical protein [Kaistella flava (ex Peng et al. 2021)]